MRPGALYSPPASERRLGQRPVHRRKGKRPPLGFLPPTPKPASGPSGQQPCSQLEGQAVPSGGLLVDLPVSFLSYDFL